MRLELLAPRSTPPVAETGTPAPDSGVGTGGTDAGAEVVLHVPRRMGLREWGLLALVTWSLLGLGERCRVNERLTSPSRTLTTYWEALRNGDDATAAECLCNGPQDLPMPGQLWFLPPTSRFELAEFRSLPVASGRVMVTYEVRYLPTGTSTVLSFHTGNELVRERGEWRIARRLGEASMPDWSPVRRAVDS